MKYLDIKGKTIIDKRGRDIGRLEGLLLDVKYFRVNSMIISNTLFFTSYYLAPISKASYEHDAITIRNEPCKIKKSVLVRNKWIQLQNYMEKEIINISGKKIGKLVDVFLDCDNKRLCAMVVSNGFFEDLFEGRKIILVNNNVIFEERNIIVDDRSLRCRNDVFFRKYLRD